MRRDERRVGVGEPAEGDRLVVALVGCQDDPLAGQAALEQVVDGAVNAGKRVAAAGVRVEREARGCAVGGEQLSSVGSGYVGHWASWDMILAYWSKDTGSSVLCT
ncbi:hypothetical protein GKE82_05595 [Conexibacter sp. W3-3-2]|uniref:hypothetical protein n=1 Tax=Conexibacter sp. W3-3-2 TaxID=2675227 RepID=UPI0012B9129E|nr:hypothetical protein [Conexibacter sp. W3-3-2]MTD43793.1 hypothetical protein [Conexibacter sp. W3-3-2]